MLTVILPALEWLGADRCRDRCSTPRGPRPPGHRRLSLASGPSPPPLPDPNVGASPSPFPGKSTNLDALYISWFLLQLFEPDGGVSLQIFGTIRMRAVLPSTLQRGGGASSHLPPLGQRESVLRAFTGYLPSHLSRSLPVKHAKF
ncbi:hypothetical protein B296_00026911 [Ensete ventricosum]|uniref:Uncharacterized protein n=1 Tax=Ensete ventricosum TaxID=4639 RepID=A0A426Z097_ENSVE|nr:hypothetical protein B296_00026911 [Ensete ventricosum]